MKQLTTEQTNYIDYVLRNDYSFEYFDDLRIELLDHIATEIEEVIQNNNISFDDAFVTIMTKWNPLILPKTWSRYQEIPYIVAKLWKSLDWKFQFSAIPITLVISLLAYYSQQNDVSGYLFLLPILITGVFANVYLLIRKNNNKVNSTLSTYALQKIYGKTLTLLGFLIINAFFISEGTTETILPLFWPSTYVSLLMLGKALVMHKHIKIENQLLKVI